MSVNKSTNVRTHNWPRLVVGSLAAVAPRLAARLAARWFLRPARRPVVERELPTLRAGVRRDLLVDGERVATWSWGDGPAVLLVHGWGGSAGQMHALVAPLVAAGARVIAVDAPAHGASGGAWLSLPRYARTLARVAAELGRLHAIVTHSFGGPAASLAVADGLPAERLVQISPPADALDWFGKFSAGLDLSPALAAATLARIEERVRLPFARLNAAAIGPRVTLPTLVIHDRDDREVPWTDGAAVAVSAPHASIFLTSGLGHRRILMDAEVIARVVGFVTDGVERPAGDLWEIETDLRDRARRWDRLAAAAAAES